MPNTKRQEAVSKVLQKRIRQFTRLEKAFYTTIIITAITMAVSIIYLQSRNLELQQEISSLNAQINEKETEFNNAKQEVNELSRRERILEVIEKFGLTPQEDNIQKVE